jgi:hypothetical protein
MSENPQLSLDLNKSCNHFELRLEDGVAQGKHLAGGKITLYSEIWVDGHHIDEPHFIDLPILVQSLYEQRWFDIFTCECGVGMCAGIVDGIQITRDAGLVRWSFRRPLAADNLLDPELSEWEKTAVPVVMVFERTQMVKAIEDYLDAIRTLVCAEPSRFEWPVHGLSVSDVVKIDPNKPFYDIEGGD